jgi:hypothetical protein
VKIAVLSKTIHMFSAIPIKITMTFFTQNIKINPKICKEAQKTLIVKPILSKRSNSGVITISDFKLYYRAIMIKTA